MQEMHEQKMHYLREFHRREIQHHEKRIAEVERKGSDSKDGDAGRLAWGFDSGVGVERAHQGRGVGGVEGEHGQGDGDEKTEGRHGEAWRVMGAAREEGTRANGREVA